MNKTIEMEKKLDKQIEKLKERIEISDKAFEKGKDLAKRVETLKQKMKK